jgi:hypothetical protein
MAKSKPIYDVFVSYRRQDEALAFQVTTVLKSYGLEVFSDSQIALDDQFENMLWEAMAESRALVAVVSNEISAQMALEVGAAKAWNKPLYLVAMNPASVRLPFILPSFQVYPVARIDELAQVIQRSSKPLSDAESNVLVAAYCGINVSVDELALRPKQLSKLTKLFRRQTGRQVPGEQLLEMLLRLRKHGMLPAAPKKNPRT